MRRIRSRMNASCALLLCTVQRNDILASQTTEQLPQPAMMMLVVLHTPFVHAVGTLYCEVCSWRLSAQRHTCRPCLEVIVVTACRWGLKEERRSGRERGLRSTQMSAVQKLSHLLLHVQSTLVAVDVVVTPL